MERDRPPFADHSCSGGLACRGCRKCGRRGRIPFAGGGAMDVLQIRTWPGQVVPSRHGAACDGYRGPHGRDGVSTGDDPTGCCPVGRRWNNGHRSLCVPGAIAARPLGSGGDLSCAHRDTCFQVGGSQGGCCCPRELVSGETRERDKNVREPRLLDMARSNFGLQDNFPLRPPNPKTAVLGLWLRTEDDAGRDRLLSWDMGTVR